MENSASNYPNNKDSKSSTLSDPGFNSDYGIYNSTGQLLKGNELFEQYTELAKQLDTKRSAFYLDLKENEIIFGCSLIVKADNGREERVVFIQVNKNLPLRNDIKSNIQLLNQFYQKVKFEVEKLELKKYRLIGLWNEGDFQNIKGIPIEEDFLEYTAGKISERKKVSVKISELSNGLSLILELVIRLRNRFSFIFDVSQYPSDSDVSISLIKPNPDFEIRENGKFQKFAQQSSWDLYTQVGKYLFKDKSDSKGSQNRPNSKSLILKKILDEPNKYCDSSNPIFDDFDDEGKVDIFQGLILKAKDTNDADIRKILVNIYGKIEASKCRKEIHIILLSNNIYIGQLIKDLVIKIYKTHNKDFFDVLFNDNTSPDNFSINDSGKSSDELEKWKKKVVSKNDSNSDPFEKEIKKALKDLEYSEKVNFVKFIASEAPSKPEKKGRILLESLITDLVVSNGNKDFILELNDEELKNLEKIQDTHYLAKKKELNEEKRNSIIEIVFCAGLLVMIALIAYFYIIPFLTGGSGDINSSSDNQTNISKSNQADIGEGYNNSSINNPVNNSTLNENDLGKEYNNSSSKNKTNNSKSNEIDKEKGEANSKDIISYIIS